MLEITWCSFVVVVVLTSSTFWDLTLEKSLEKKPLLENGSFSLTKPVPDNC